MEWTKCMLLLHYNKYIFHLFCSWFPAVDLMARNKTFYYLKNLYFLQRKLWICVVKYYGLIQHLDHFMLPSFTSKLAFDNNSAVLPFLNHQLAFKNHYEICIVWITTLIDFCIVSTAQTWIKFGNWNVSGRSVLSSKNIPDLIYKR